MSRILIVAGGTGGHVFPALAVAKKLVQQDVAVHWLGSKTGMESRWIEPLFPISYVDVKSVRGKRFFRKLLSPYFIVVSIIQSCKIIRACDPQIILGMGGFVAGPACIAAWLMRRPIVIHEQNAIAGYTNKILTHFTKHILQAFPAAFPKSISAVTVGNPLRQCFLNTVTPRERYADTASRPLRLFILGGSRGARAINIAVISMLNKISDQHQLELWHQTGSLDYESVQESYSKLQIKARVESFVDDVVEAYTWADLLICRAGALTVSEVAAIGVASIFVPLPSAVDDHQTANARYLSDNNAAILIQQKDLTTDRLLDHIHRFLANRSLLLEMAQRARDHAKPIATCEVASYCTKLIEKSHSILVNKEIKHIFCIGIGGIGVSGLAEILLRRGYKVSGSDAHRTAITERLERLGINVFKSHDRSNLKGVDAVVYSTAIPSDNAERQEALRLKLPIVRRGQLLAELMNLTTSIAVSGTHGKTTTTGLTSYLLVEAGVNPTCVMGGILNNLSSPIIVGDLDYFVAEADESDASFMHMYPTVAVVTNIEADHMETYNNDFNCLKQTFIDFLRKLPKHGVAVLCIDDPIVKEIEPHIFCNKITYGFSSQAMIQASNFHQERLQTSFKVKINDECHEVALNLPGRHNVLNALASISVAFYLKLSISSVIDSFKSFPGVGRRFYSHGSLKVEGGSALLFDDYGHHPTEVDATLTAAKEAWPSRRIVLVFQPHRYTRTRDLFDDFIKVLAKTEMLVLLDVYSAGEDPIEGADGKALYKAVHVQQNNAIFVEHNEDLLGVLKTVIQPDDIVLLQGAGSIGPLAANLSRQF